MSTPVKPLRIEGLSALEFDEAYYEEHRQAGLDYLSLGLWQKHFAELITLSCRQRDLEEAIFLDLGCACGTYVQAFKELGIYSRVYGVDLSAHMIGLGRRHFGLSDQELIRADAREIPLPDASVTLVNTMQMLEHVAEATAEKAISEIARVLIPGGRAFACLDAIKRGQTADDYSYDPTHVNIKPLDWWTSMFAKYGLIFDLDAYEVFARSPIGPGDREKSFFWHYPEWSAWTLYKT